jgi:hypothetical protein
MAISALSLKDYPSAHFCVDNRILKFLSSEHLPQPEMQVEEEISDLIICQRK